MKGTLFSADFVKETNGNFRLLEINTDTGFVNAALPQFDLAAFEAILAANNITKVHVVYKSFQTNFVDYLEQYLTDNASYITDFDRVQESVFTVYPSTPVDAADKFILRLAYDESALLDSEYAKGTLNLFKLFSDNSASSDVVEYYHSSTDFTNDNLPRVLNGVNEPDIVVKGITDGANSALKFIKLGQSSKTDTERYDDAIAELGTANTVIQKFYSAGTSTHSNSYRSFHIVYGGTLDIINLASYNAKAFLDRPTSINNDDAEIFSVTDTKHYFELATNFPIFTQHGIFENERLLDASGSSIAIASASVGTSYKSFHIEGAPDTDNMIDVFAWSATGSVFPSGSYENTSVLNNLSEKDLEYNLISKVTLNNPAGDVFRLAPSTAVLIYDASEDQMKYVKVKDIDTSDNNFIQLNGTLIGISGNEIEVLEDTHKVYTPNLETTDNFILDGVDIQGFNIITHNYYRATCFAAGTEITLANGDVKNIEDIVEGDEVLSFCYCDDNGCEKEFKAGVVTAIDHRHNVGSHADACESLGDEPSLYTINNTGIAFTPEHPFLTKEGFKSLMPDSNQAPYNGEQVAKVLVIGDEILTENGDYITVETIEVLRSDAEEKVYNFTVADTHTYIANGLVVHNK
jgi:hypothetical protein